MAENRELLSGTGQAFRITGNRETDRQKSFALLVGGYLKDLFATGMILQRLDLCDNLRNNKRPSGQ